MQVRVFNFFKLPLVSVGGLRIEVLVRDFGTKWVWVSEGKILRVDSVRGVGERMWARYHYWNSFFTLRWMSRDENTYRYNTYPSNIWRLIFWNHHGPLKDVESIHISVVNPVGCRFGTKFLTKMCVSVFRLIEEWWYHSVCSSDAFQNLKIITTLP